MSFDTTALADATVTDPTDRSEVRLGDLWADQTQIILFLRHFG